MCKPGYLFQNKLQNTVGDVMSNLKNKRAYYSLGYILTSSALRDSKFFFIFCQQAA